MTTIELKEEDNHTSFCCGCYYKHKDPKVIGQLCLMTQESDLICLRTGSVIEDPSFNNYELVDRIEITYK